MVLTKVDLKTKFEYNDKQLMISQIHNEDEVMLRPALTECISGQIYRYECVLGWVCEIMLVCVCVSIRAN